MRAKREARGGKFIQGMHLKKGALHRQLGIPQGKKIPMSTIHRAEHSDNKLLSKRAHTADMLKHLNH